MTDFTSCGGTTGRSDKRQPGEKRFQCGQCSKRFPTSKDLKRHDVVHTGNREFQCSFCSHRFGRKDHRMRHEKKTHANELLSSPISPKDGASVFVKRERGEELPPPVLAPSVSGHHHMAVTENKKRWRHVSSPSITSSDFDMDSPIRLRAMSTSEPYHQSPPHTILNSDKIQDLKYLESQLSPESLQETGSSMSPDLNSVKEESEDTCLSSCNGSEDTCKSDLDWIMSDFMSKSETKVVESVLSPSPDSSSLSPPGFYSSESGKHL